MTIVDVQDDRFAAHWRTLQSSARVPHPFLTDLDVAYSKAYAADSSFEDRSFLIENAGIPLMGLRFSIHRSPAGLIGSGFGRPIGFFESPNLAPTARDSAGSELQREFLRRLPAGESVTIRYRELSPTLGLFGRHLLASGGTCEPAFTQIVDLRLEEESLRQAVRKSYKSLINWGNKAMSLELYDSSNFAEHPIEEFRQLHIEAAGRETRSVESWRIQGEMIRNAEAFLILGRWEGALVTGALFPRTPHFCYYGVSASKRELFDKPLGHAVLWKAMLHAKATGCTQFELGDQLFPATGSTVPTQKEIGISTFKRGFGGDTHLWPWIRLTSSPVPADGAALPHS